MPNPRVAASFAALALCLAVTPTAAQDNEYFTVPPQLFAPGRPARPTVTYILDANPLSDDFDLTPVVIVTDELMFDTAALQYISASGVPVLLGSWPFGGANPTQSATGSFGGLNPEPPIFTAMDGPRGGAGKATIQVHSNWGETSGQPGYLTSETVFTDATYGPGVSIATGSFFGGLLEDPNDVVLAHPTSITLLEGIQSPGGPPLIERGHFAVGSSPDEEILDVKAGELDGLPGDEVIIATRNISTNTGAVYIYKVNDVPAGQSTASLDQIISMGGVASVHVLDADPLLANGNELIVVEHVLVGSNSSVNVRMFERSGSVFLEAGNSPLLTRSSPINILPRYGAVGDIDGLEPGTDDLVLVSNDGVVGVPNTSATPPLFIDRFISDGTGNFEVSTRFTRFAGRAVDPVLYNPATITIASSSFAGLGDAPGSLLPNLNLSFEVDLGAGSATSHQTNDEGFSFVFDNDGQGAFEDRGDELIHAPDEYLAGVGDGHVHDVDDDENKVGGGPDVVLPLRDSNHVRVQYGDGVGLGTRVETFTAVASPPLTAGGPTDVWSGDLDGAFWDDIVVWSEYGSSEARWSVHHETTGSGEGTWTQNQQIVLPSAGDMVVDDATDDGFVDLVATQHRALASSVLLTIATGASGSLFGTPATLAADTGVRCLGGLASGDWDGDAVVDFVTTYRSAAGSSGAAPNTWGFVVVESDGAGGYTRTYESLGAAGGAPTVESVAVTVNGGVAFVAIGAESGALWVVRNSGASIDIVSNGFQEAAETCGGHVVFLDVDGDGDDDLVSSKSELGGQAVVNLLVDDVFDGQFGYVDELQGWSASLATRGNRVLGGDFNGDGLTDLVLSHGLAGAASLLINNGIQWASVPAGTGGANGPLALNASGSSRVGSALTVRSENANPFASGALLVGLASALAVPAPGMPVYLSYPSTGVGIVFVSADANGVFQITAPVLTTAIVGDVWYFQSVFYDTTVTAPLPNYAFSNGVDVTILAARQGAEVNPID